MRLFHYRTQNVVHYAFFHDKELIVLYHFACVRCVNGYVLNC